MKSSFNLLISFVASFLFISRLLYYRLDQSVKRTQKSTREETVFVNPKGDGDAVESNNLVATSALEVRLISLCSFV